MTMKKKFVVLLCLVLVLSMSVSVYAGQHVGRSTEPVYSLDWLHTSSAVASLSFSNGLGTLGAEIWGKPGATYISGSAVLERLNADGTYSHVNTWSGLQSQSMQNDLLIWGANYYVARGHTYRLTIYATVYRNGASEDVSVSKSQYAN